MDLTTILDFFSAVSWQLITLVAIFVLRHEIREILGNLKEAKIPGAQFAFERRALLRRDSPAVRRLSPTSEGNWGNVGNIFWLGHDLMWSMNAFLMGARKVDLVHGLSQSMHHLRCLDLADGELEPRLRRILEKLESSIESDLDVGSRLEFARDLDTFADEVGAYVEVKQSDFKGFPE